MAIVTRRYLFQGPQLEDVQARTDPSLTLVSAVLKLAFDVTFDDAIATVAAVDQAMAENGGFVPDPSADTTVPPVFPGGGWLASLILTSTPLSPVDPNQVIQVDSTTGPFAISLPQALNLRGVLCIIKDVGGVAATNPVTIAPSGGDTIDSGGAYILDRDRGAVTFCSDGGTNWNVISER